MLIIVTAFLPVSMSAFSMSQLAEIPTSEDGTNHGNGYKGLHVWALLRRVDACLDLGITCTEKCASETSEFYIKLLFFICMSLDKYK
jgi:hypothetical protein